MSKTEHRVGLLQEGCGTLRTVAKGVGMRAVRGSSSGGEEWEGINREWTGSK